MSQGTERQDFGVEHHALLFGWLAKAVIERAGEERGAQVVRKAVRQYGEERGGRMALRAQGNRHALSMANFSVYGEWRAAAGESESEEVARAPHRKVRVHRCPWHAAWKENGLMPYALYYCLEIDEALMRGYNPNLVLEVHSTLPEGAEYCEFLFRDANLTVLNRLSLWYKGTFKPGQAGKMPWEYHTGHLWATVRAVALDELGQTGVEAVQAALAEFSARFGEQAAETITGYEGVDFAQLPG